jgi:hypothetical protein
MTAENIEDRLARLKAEWPAGSIVDRVMSQLGTAPQSVSSHRLASPRLPRRPRLVAALAASGLIAALGLAWVLIASHPATLQAAVEQYLARAATAHLEITVWDQKGQASKSEIWYRRGEGLRAEAAEEVIVEDNQFQWSWRPGSPSGELIVLRQPRPGFFGRHLTPLLSLPDLPSFIGRDRAPELDREIAGRACRGYIIAPKGPDPYLPPGATTEPFRGLVIADTDDRVHQITIQLRRKDGQWQSVRQISIAYDAPVPPERIAARLPEGAHVVDRDGSFNSLYPLERAIRRVEVGDLLFAVHDLRPIKDRDGVYVVSSVRGTPEYLRKFPPRRRWINPEVSALDVAFQMPSNGMLSGKYDRIGLATASREGVEYAWWMVIPRKPFVMKAGKPVFLPRNETSWIPGEPGRLDDPADKFWVPLSATYFDEHHKSAQGVSETVSQWVQIDLPLGREPGSFEEIAARARRDLLTMRHGGSYALLGIAADTRGDADNLKHMSHFEPNRITDADYAAAVLRGIDDLRQLDEVHEGGASGAAVVPSPKNDKAPPR